MARPFKFEHDPNARPGGVILFIFGLVFIGIDIYLWEVRGVAYAILLSAALVLPALGLWAIITGKMPKR
jgi:hypothetical protein